MSNVHSKKRAALALAAVFVAGVVSGIAGTRFLGGSRARAAHMTPGQYRSHLLDTLTQRLDLTENQQAKVDEVLDRINERFRSVSEAIEPEMEAIRAERAERIGLVLTPSQRDEYEKFLDERRKRRQAHLNRLHHGNLPR